MSKETIPFSKINQKHYGQLEVENREPDIVQIWMKEPNDYQVIFIERENVRALINELEKTIL